MSNVFSSSKQSNIPWTLESALAASVSDGTFADVELSLFSRRLAAGKVGHPRPVYANSAVLKRASSYFHGLLEGGFVEGDVYAGSPSFPTSTDEYDYESDSDLEDDGIDETDVENEREVARGSEDAPPSPQAGDEPRKGKEIARPHSGTPAREASRPGLRRVMIKNSAFNTNDAVLRAGINFFEDHCVDISALPPLQRKLELISAGDFTHGVPVVLSLFNACITLNKKKKSSSSASLPPKTSEPLDTESPAESEKLHKDTIPFGQYGGFCSGPPVKSSGQRVGGRR
ncbi:hypothetical protein IEO21_05525 [Rhodonia placenta]|uniref:Uncharacterized protein n=1 Tax=Rhodonia placenta TaxID=104341 RepID=A0A8H7P1R6_9APHY|nr:hypothetical protein IEO21_05525 [Postia placenta]